MDVSGESRDLTQLLSSGLYPSQSTRYSRPLASRRDLRMRETAYAGPSISRGAGGSVLRAFSARGPGNIGFSWEMWKAFDRGRGYPQLNGADATLVTIG